VVVGCVVEIKDQSGNSVFSVDVIEWAMDIAARSQVKVRCINSVDVVKWAVKDQSGNSVVSVDVIEWAMDIAARSQVVVRTDYMHAQYPWGSVIEDQSRE
jgi:hypothetical protein